MDKSKVQDALNKLKEHKKKFKQSYDLILILKGIDIKKNENQLDFYIQLHFNRGKKVKTAALVGSELIDEARQHCDRTIIQDDFKTLEKKELKKLAGGIDFFIAQANIMPAVAAAFGKILGPKGKMPNPKAGCVVPPKTNLKALIEKLQKTARIKVKTSLMAQITVGREDQPESEIIDNILTAVSQVTAHLPVHENNISRILLKKTMSPVVVLQ